MSQRIIQICDRCKVELDTSVNRQYLQNYQYHHTVKIQVLNSYVKERENKQFDLCPDCEEKLFKFLANTLERSDLPTYAKIV
jgi:hypothetical protein